MDETSSFCTVINCMDGRVQLPIISFLQRHFQSRWVDSVTIPGPCRVLADGDSKERESILDRVKVSVVKHGSRRIAVAAHHDCAGNPVDDATQCKQVLASAAWLQTRFPDCEVAALWVDRQWQVSLLS